MGFLSLGISLAAQTSQLADPFDSVVMATDGLKLSVLIEDEILSALPIAPIHGPDAHCVESGGALDESKIEAGKPNRPLSGLALLLDAARKDRID